MKRHLLFVLAVLFYLPGCSASTESEEVAINYMTIGPIYFVPYTLEKFNRERGEPARVDPSDPRLREFLALTENAEPAAFNEGRVRARLAHADGSIIYVDNWGGVRLPDKEVRLKEADLPRAAALLASLTGVHALAHNERDWVQKAVWAHIRQTESWAPMVDINVSVAPRAEPDTLIAEVRHELDTTCLDPDYELVESRYFELHFDRASREIIRKIRYERSADPSKPCTPIEETKMR